MNLIKRAAAMTIGVPKRQASGATPFDAAGQGRRMLQYQSTDLGLNTLLYSNGNVLLQRSRDAIRNNCWATSAIDTFTANAVGKGIRMVSQHPDQSVKDKINNLWNRWCKECDVEYDPKNVASAQSDFIGHLILICREVFEAGEGFVRFIPRSPKENLAVPLQLQLLESEQLPIWRSDTANVPEPNRVRLGVEFRPDNRRAAYHFYKSHPGETMFFPQDALHLERVDAKDVLHVYSMVRAGQIRGMPKLTAVLAKLYSLDKYFDSEIFRKEVSSMITGFIKSVTPNDAIYQADTTVAQPTDPSQIISQLQPGSFPVLNPGEDIEFADVKDNGNFSGFMRTALQAFASGVGLAEYQVSADLSGISYSSIRAGLLEFRRKCEQFQHAVLVFQVCHPIYRRWLQAAMMSLKFGVALMNEYVEDPTQFEDVKWVTPGWPWVDPEKELRAAQMSVRSGFSDRNGVCAERGVDSEDIDNQQKTDNKRADALDLSYDSDGRKVLTGKNAGLTEEEISEMAQNSQETEPAPSVGG